MSVTSTSVKLGTLLATVVFGAALSTEDAVAQTAPPTGPILSLSGLCLDVEGGSTQAGARLIVYPCHGQPNQVFSALPDGTIRGVGGQCLDVEGASTAPGARVIMYPCHGQPNQRWQFAPDGTIRGVGGQCLDIEGGNITPGTGLIMYPCHAQLNQLFRPVAAPVPANLVVNGSFEEVALPPGSWQLVPQIPGWTLSRGTAFELQSGVAGAAYEGRQLLELDGDGPSWIVQDVPTRPRQRYTLSLAFSPRPGTAVEDNDVIVRFDGRVVGRLRASGSALRDTSWTTFTVEVSGSGPRGRIEILDAGAANGLGSYVDDVRLVPLPR